MIPPKYLYHGTSFDYIDQIEQEGLKPVTYDKVFLTADYFTAYEYAKYRIRTAECNAFLPIICVVDALSMYEDGFVFTEGCSYQEYTITKVPSYYIETFMITNEYDLEALAHYAQE